MKYFLLIAVLILGLISCLERPGAIYKKKLVQLNSISHIFNLQKSDLRDTVLRMFNFDDQYHSKYLNQVFFYYLESDIKKEHKFKIDFVAETAIDASFGSEHFKLPQTKEDIYLHDFGEFWNSPLYMAKGNPLSYCTPFSLHFDSLGSSQTKLTIQSENPTVANGEASWTAHGPVSNIQKVQPTTIEEHQLLLFIADKLGDTMVEPTRWPVQ